MRYQFQVPDSKKIRVIINTDAKNEADDQYAIVHALLTERFIVKGIIAAHFGTRRTQDSMSESYEEIQKVQALMGDEAKCPTAHGHDKQISDQGAAFTSEGSDLIIQEALSNDTHPLFCIFLGPLTDMAVALRKNPAIETKLTVIWIGGGVWPEGGEEFNLSNDIASANIVYASKVNLWQVPRNVYGKLRVSLAELQRRVRPYGEIGKYLFEQMIDFNNAMGNNIGWPLGETWVLGDSAAIGLMLDDQSFDYDMVSAPLVREDMSYGHETGNRLIRMYTSVDSRFILEDFFCKMELNFADRPTA